MNLYNASLPSDTLRGFTRNITNTNSTTYTDAELDASVNMYLDLFTTEILDSMDEWDFQGEIATTDLVANQQEYVFPSDILKIKRVEVSYDGTNWYEAAPMDVNERGGANDSTSIRNDFTTNKPYYDLMDNSVFLFPIPTAASTAGIKIFYEKLQTHLSADTDSPNFVRSFHKGLCYGAAKDYFEKFLGERSGFDIKLQNAKNELEEYIMRMKSFYRRRNQDRQYIVGAVDVDYDYGNDY